MRTLPLLLLSACLVPSEWLESLELGVLVHEDPSPHTLEPEVGPSRPNPATSPHGGLPEGVDPSDTAVLDEPHEPAPLVDDDGDGALSDVDCDDHNAEVFPGAAERCGNGRDDDCDPTPYTCGLGPDVTDAAASWHVLGNHTYAALGTRLLGGEDLTGDGQPNLVATSACPASANGSASCGGLLYVLNIAGHAPGFADAETTHHARLIRGDKVSPVPALAFGRGGGATRLHVADPWAPWGEGGAIQRLSSPLKRGTTALGEEGTWVEGGSEDAPLAPAVAVLPTPSGDAVLTLAVDGPTGLGRLFWGHADASREGGWPLTEAWDGTQLVAGTQEPSTDDVVDVSAGWDVVGSPEPDFAIATLDEQGGAAFHAWSSLPRGTTLDLADGSLRSSWTLAPGAHQGVLRVHLVPDVTGDGRADLIAVAPCVHSLCASGGQVWVVPGGQLHAGQQADLAAVGVSQAGLHLRAPGARAALGAAVGTADLNGDGQADLVIGAPGDAGGLGSVYVLYGPLPTGDFSTVDVGHALVGSRILGTELSAGFGSSLHGAGDLDGDGADEIAVGAPRAQGVTGNYAVGRIFVLAGGAE